VLKAMLLTKLKSVAVVTMAMVLTLGIGTGLLTSGKAAGRQDSPVVSQEAEQEKLPAAQKDGDTNIAAFYERTGHLKAAAFYRQRSEKAEKAEKDKKVMGPAKEIMKMKIERLLNERQDKSEAKTIIEDKEQIAQVLAFFPETGTGKRPDRSFPRPKVGDGSSYFITLHRMKSDPDFIMYIMVSPDRKMWGWSEGGLPCNDDWNLNKPKEVAKFLDELLEATPKQERDKDKDKDKESFTAWGKEINGLQAGLEVRPSEKRLYHYGETITLIVRVRNVGKQAVKFEYLRQFLDENSPTVTDAGGAIPQRNTEVTGLRHVPVEVTLEPGKEIVLESRLGGASGVRHELKPADLGGMPTTGKFPPLYVGTGKVSLQYEPVLGDSSSGQINLDPALAKLGTGELELEVKEKQADEKRQAPKAEDADKERPWGVEVEGLQCRLRANKPVWRNGEAPAFKLDVRNQGKRDLQIHMAADACEVELDGTWYRWQGPVSIISGTWSAGRRYDDFEVPISLGKRWTEKLGKPMDVAQGKHTVRVAYLTLDRERPVRAVSNAVEITMTAEPKDDK
jgi:hypothetical protein